MSKSKTQVAFSNIYIYTERHRKFIYVCFCLSNFAPSDSTATVAAFLAGASRQEGELNASVLLDGLLRFCFSFLESFGVLVRGALPLLSMVSAFRRFFLWCFCFRLLGKGISETGISSLAFARGRMILLESEERGCRDIMATIAGFFYKGEHTKWRQT